MRTLVPSPERRSFVEQATALYQTSVDQVAEKLAARGLTDTKVSSRLGLVVDPLPGHEDMRGRLSIPYLTRTGPVALKFRCLKDHNCKQAGCPKYLGEKGEPPRLFNTLALSVPSPTLFVTEGELDALAVTSLVGVPAVGVPGASAWEPLWARAVPGYEQVVLLADGDTAGEQLAEAMAKCLDNFRFIRLPDGEDSSSLLMSEGVDAFRRRIGVE